jgi:hypothetical protein
MVCDSDVTRSRRYQPIERQCPSCGLLSRPSVLDGPFDAPCAQCGWKAAAHDLNKPARNAQSFYSVPAPRVPLSHTLDSLERRIVLTLLRMVWRQARADGQRNRMESIACLGKTIRLTHLGDRFVQ